MLERRVGTLKDTHVNWGAALEMCEHTRGVVIDLSIDGHLNVALAFMAIVFVFDCSSGQRPT